MNDLLGDLTLVLWRQSWQLLVLGLLVWPISRWSQRRYPKFAYFLWLLIAVKTLIPVRFTLPQSTALSVPDLGALVLLPEITSSLKTDSGPAVLSILGIIWLSVFLFLATKLLINEVRFKRSIRGAQSLEVSGLNKLLQHFGITRNVTIISSKQISVPMTFGLKQPVIILPESQLEGSSQDFMPVLAHELAHIQRRDLITITFQVVMNMLFWFHPVMRQVNRHLDLNRERICDEMAMEALGLQPKTYGRELLTHLEASLTPHPELVMSGGMFMSKRNVLKRFEYLMDGRGRIMLKIKNGQKLIIGLIMVVMLVLSCSDVSQPDTLGVSPAGKDLAKDTNPVAPGTSSPEKENTVYDTPPEPIGGYSAIQKAVIYPETARESGTEGTVIVQVVVQKDGTTSDAVVLKGVPDTGLDEAAMDAVGKISWKPALLKEKPVAVRIALPVVFRLKTG